MPGIETWRQAPSITTGQELGSSRRLLSCQVSGSTSTNAGMAASWERRASSSHAGPARSRKPAWPAHCSSWVGRGSENPSSMLNDGEPPGGGNSTRLQRGTRSTTCGSRLDELDPDERRRIREGQRSPSNAPSARPGDCPTAPRARLTPAAAGEPFYVWLAQSRWRERDRLRKPDGPVRHQPQDQRPGRPVGAHRSPERAGPAWALRARLPPPRR